jgi:hypothetical protein
MSTAPAHLTAPDLDLVLSGDQSCGGRSPGGGFMLKHCALQRLQRAPLKLGLGNRVLSDQPRGLGAIGANPGFAGPARGIQGGCQTGGARIMQRAHSGVIPLEQGAVVYFPELFRPMVRQGSPMRCAA